MRELREQTGLSRVEFSALLGISPKTVEHWEYGTRKPAPYLIKLVEYYLISEGYIKRKEGDGKHEGF